MRATIRVLGFRGLDYYNRVWGVYAILVTRNPQNSYR